MPHDPLSIHGLGGGGVNTVKCEPEPERARAQVRGHVSITPGGYLDKRHWILLGPGLGITERLVTDAVEDSYDLVAGRRPRPAP
jgi:predicted DNA-binding protein (MmcQ/YjbR family)